MSKFRNAIVIIGITLYWTGSSVNGGPRITSMCQSINESAIVKGFYHLAASETFDRMDHRVRRWVDKPIDIFVQSEIKANHLEIIISEAIEKYNKYVFHAKKMTLVEFSIKHNLDESWISPSKLPNDTSRDGVYISIFNDENYKKLDGVVSNILKNEASMKEFQRSNCFFTVTYDHHNLVRRAAVWISKSAYDIPSPGCVYEELNHVLGIERDDHAIPCTIHTGIANTVDEMRFIDRVVLEILYSPVLDPNKTIGSQRQAIEQLSTCAVRREIEKSEAALSEYCEKLHE